MEFWNANCPCVSPAHPPQSLLQYAVLFKNSQESLMLLSILSRVTRLPEMSGWNHSLVSWALTFQHGYTLFPHLLYFPKYPDLEKLILELLVWCGCFDSSAPLRRRKVLASCCLRESKYWCFLKNTLLWDTMHKGIKNSNSEHPASHLIWHKEIQLDKYS